MTVFSLKKRRLISAFWFLISYFSIFFCQLAVEGQFKIRQGFTGDIIAVNENTILNCVVFVFAFNILFALSEMTMWGLFSRGNAIIWNLPQTPAITATRIILAIMLVVSGIWYFFKMQGLGYRGYVEFKGSNWPSVFFIASSGFIAFSALQKKYVTAFLGSVPFLFFMFALKVRSLALVSLIPATLIFLFQVYTADRKKAKIRAVIYGIIILCGLLTISFFSDYYKGVKVTLPDSGMPFGFAAMVQKTLNLNQYTGWNSLQNYSVNILSPFYKLFRIDLPLSEDTPVYMAWLIDGVPKWWKIHFHYPALIYADAFVSFGRAGILLGLLWGAILSLMEVGMAKNSFFLGLFLPIYTWHTYMICRGAIAIAAGPFSYVFYILIILAVVIRFFFPNRRITDENS
jgi:hypothetical protein